MASGVCSARMKHRTCIRLHGAEFETLYEQYEKEGRAKKTIKAQDLWFAILDAQIETGTPYMLYKDAANEKSNQKNLGTIHSSNLCTEIIEYSADKEVRFVTWLLLHCHVL